MIVKEFKMKMALPQCYYAENEQKFYKTVNQKFSFENAFVIANSVSKIRNISFKKNTHNIDTFLLLNYSFDTFYLHTLSQR